MQPVPVPSSLAENKEDSSIERHSRKCQICRHPDREAIDEQYVHWVRPTSITKMYNVEWKALYRHVRALGLVQKRSRNMRSVLENILEHGPEAPVTADAILRTVRAYCACLTEDNHWVDPPTPVLFTTQHQFPQPTAPPPPALASPPTNHMAGQTAPMNQTDQMDQTDHQMEIAGEPPPDATIAETIDQTAAETIDLPPPHASETNGAGQNDIFNGNPSLERAYRAAFGSGIEPHSNRDTGRLEIATTQ